MSDDGRLRAATFGCMDGATTSVAVSIGLLGSGVDLDFVVLAGIAAGVSGSMSMAIGEYVSVQTHNEQPDAHLFNPYTAAVSSFVCFVIGSLIPMIPLLLGLSSVIVLCIVGGTVLFGAGAISTRFTHRSWIFGGMRQLLFGSVATAITFGLSVLLA